MGTGLGFFIIQYSETQPGYTNKIYVRIGDGTYYPGVQYPISGLSWNHITFVIDRKNYILKLYINSVLRGTADINKAMGNATLDTDVGGIVNSWYLDGDLGFNS
jgi:hypothetical protein